MKILVTIVLVALTLHLQSQPVGYYNGTEGKTGAELKAALHHIIRNHLAWEYTYSKNIMAISDRKPGTTDSIILFYTGFTKHWNYYGTGGDYVNREHVFAKSHGGFGTAKPTGSDVHNLKPAMASVNIDRSNKDFDVCQGQPGAVQHPIATECYYTANAWEPRDAVKGDAARIIFYMATRYEGTNGEPDLEVADYVNTYPLPLHGKLSALYQWNQADLPDAFERNRNDVIYSFQKNRNPFIDNPRWVQMIWGDLPADPIAIGNMAQSPQVVKPTDNVTITCTAQGNGPITATLKWGTAYTSLTNVIPMTFNNGTFIASIPPQSANSVIYLQVQATNGSQTSSSVVYNYKVQPQFSGTITPIINVQGQAASSPMVNQIVTVTGVVTGNFGDGYFIQDARAPWSGLYIYDIGRNPDIGDSVIVTGKIVEYFGLTEMTNITHFQLVAKNKPLPEPIVIQAGQDKEPYESVLVKILGAQVVSTNEGYGMWKVNDKTGDMMIHNTMLYAHTPVLGAYYDITGPLTYTYSDWKIELRSAADVQPGSDLDKPYVVDINLASPQYMWIYFNEPIKASTVSNLSNYQFSGGINLLWASRHAIQTHVAILNLEGVTLGMHTVTIRNIEDLAGNVMNEATFNFFSPYNNIETNDLDDDIKLYPNPTVTGVITIENTRSVVEIEISDMAGRVIHKVNNPDRLQNILVGGLPVGQLLVRMNTTENKLITKTIIVQ